GAAARRNVAGSCRLTRRTLCERSEWRSSRGATDGAMGCVRACGYSVVGMKVAYVFSTSGHTASYKLGRMILPQLEQGTHGVEVVGMFFFDDLTRRDAAARRFRNSSHRAASLPSARKGGLSHACGR